MESPELPRPDENPFDPPKQPVRYTAPAERVDHERQRRRRILLILLGLVLVPIAAVIGGFVGCFAGLGAMSVVGSEEAWISVWLLAIAIEAITGGGLTIYLLVLAAKRP